MTNIYKHFFSLFNHEKERLDRKISVRQDVPEPAFRISVVVVAALLGLGVSRLLLGSSTPRQILEDHPMCGITTGGQVRLETSICFCISTYILNRNMNKKTFKEQSLILKAF